VSTNINSTIVALGTGASASAIGIIRLSGNDAIAIVDNFFEGKKKLIEAKSHSIKFGKIIIDYKIIDEVVIAIYKAPHSYTGENIVEINCHGSAYIIEQIINVCLINGARLAEPGEFTKRAFMYGKLDLSQAEAVADLIASGNASQHAIAMNQMRGGISTELDKMRTELINFAALLELELDFSEEDVAFADRAQFEILLNNIKAQLTQLKNSFAYGNAIKNGIPVAIVGKPNAGKSTLLNILLNDEKAIVSSIAGTTRDAIEDVINIDGIAFRFIDTAGIRKSEDTIEKIGIEKTYQKIKEANIILLIADVQENINDIIAQYKLLNVLQHQKIMIVLNKIDATNVCDSYDIEEAIMTINNCKAIAISAKQNMHIDKLKKLIIEASKNNANTTQDIIITNVRHANAINESLGAIENIQAGFKQNISGELIAIDVRDALFHLGSITGQVELDRDILGTIFGKFCIGK
jgi:tRNA modification GTPase